MRAAPVRSFSSRPAAWLLPSGKRQTASPASSAAPTAAKVSTFRDVSTPGSIRRYTGIAPERRMSGLTTWSAKSVDLARKRTVRPAVVWMSAGSARVFGWFATSSNGPAGSVPPICSTR